MTKRADFTKEFGLEVVRLAETSGRTRKEIAEYLGIGLSTLTRWISRNRDAGMNDPDVPPLNRTIFSWNFPFIMPLMGEGEFHESG